MQAQQRLGNLIEMNTLMDQQSVCPTRLTLRTEGFLHDQKRTTSLGSLYIYKTGHSCSLRVVRLLRSCLPFSIKAAIPVHYICLLMRYESSLFTCASYWQVPIHIFISMSNLGLLYSNGNLPDVLRYQSYGSPMRLPLFSLQSTPHH